MINASMNSVTILKKCIFCKSQQHLHTVEKVSYMYMCLSITLSHIMKWLEVFCSSIQWNQHSRFHTLTWWRKVSQVPKRRFFKRKWGDGKYRTYVSLYFQSSFTSCSQYSVVSVVTRIRAGRSGVRIPVATIAFFPPPKTSRLALGSTQRPIQWVRELFPRDKAAGAWRWPLTFTQGQG
jgi:hypothetical protein